MGKHQGRHRAQRTRSKKAPAVGAVGAAGVAAGAAAVLGLTPTLSASPELAADAYYVPGTNIGDTTGHPPAYQFADAMSSGAGLPFPAESDFTIIDYPGGFWPVSKGGLNDPTWNESVAQGVTELGDKDPQSGDTIVAFSQGAVVASVYKGQNPDAGFTYVLIENPNAPNGGLLQRFNGLYIPILDVSFNGATPEGDKTVQISREFSGWSDFPTYPLNLLATLNAIAGIAYLHGDTQDLTDPALLAALKAEGDPDHYQDHTDDDYTEYYVIPTPLLPILMPFEGIVPDEILAAADKPLRVVVQAGYDRDDYSVPTRARLFPKINPIDFTKDLADATAQGVADVLTYAGATATSPAGTPDLDLSRTLTAGDKAETERPALELRKRTLESPKSDLRERMAAKREQRAEQRAERAERFSADRPGAAVRSALKSLAPKAAKAKTQPATSPQD